jgi:hypothetical protein
MSNYRSIAFNPKTLKLEDADYIEDHYRHIYGVKFDDGSIYRIHEVGLEAAVKLLSGAAPRLPDPFEVCLMIVEEECYADDPQSIYWAVGRSIRDRIRCAQLDSAASTAPTPAAPDIESLCHDYAQRWLGQDFSSLNANHRTELAIEAHRWIKCWAAVTSTERSPLGPEEMAELVSTGHLEP